jgi:hypothetical protein
VTYFKSSMAIYFRGGLEGRNRFLGGWLAALPPTSHPKERFRGATRIQTQAHA